MNFSQGLFHSVSGVKFHPPQSGIERTDESLQQGMVLH